MQSLLSTSRKQDGVDLFSMRKYSPYCWKHSPFVLMRVDVIVTSPTPAWNQLPRSERGNSQSRDTPPLSSARAKKISKQKHVDA